MEVIASPDNFLTAPAANLGLVRCRGDYFLVLADDNIVDATMFEGLQDVLARMEASPSLRVVVFESANPEFYLSHFDLTGKTGNITTADQVNTILAAGRADLCVLDPRVLGERTQDVSPKNS